MKIQCVCILPRDAKSGRYGRNISAIFLAGANFWAILGHLGSFLGHFLVLIFVAQKCISAIFITFCISDLVAAF